jgi:hypothetical protein
VLSPAELVSLGGATLRSMGLGRVELVQGSEGLEVFDQGRLLLGSEMEPFPRVADWRRAAVYAGLSVVISLAGTFLGFVGARELLAIRRA